MPYDAEENYRKLPLMYRRKPEYMLKPEPGKRPEIPPHVPEAAEEIQDLALARRKRRRGIMLFINLGLVIGVLIWFQFMASAGADPDLFGNGTWRADFQAYLSPEGSVHAQVMLRLEPDKTGEDVEALVEWAYGSQAKDEEFKPIAKFNRTIRLPVSEGDPVFFVLDDADPKELPARVGLRLSFKDQHILIWKGLKQTRKE